MALSIANRERLCMSGPTLNRFLLLTFRKQTVKLGFSVEYVFFSFYMLHMTSSVVTGCRPLN